MGVKVFAPATVANLACGFDILGLAIHGLGDEIVANKCDRPGVFIESISFDDGKLPKHIEKNTAGVAAREVYNAFGSPDFGVKLKILKHMPLSSGMGSSAASAVAGAMAMNEVLGRPYTKRQLLRPAVLGEQVADGAFHADNVAPSLFGGIVLIRDNNKLDYVRVPSPKGLFCVVVHPDIKINTRDSRNILSSSVSLHDHVIQSGNLGALLLSLYYGDLDLLRRAFNDIIIEPQRAILIPEFYSVKEAALESGALGFCISGAGPSVFSFCPNSFIAQSVVDAITETWNAVDISCNHYISEVNMEGAKLI